MTDLSRPEAPPLAARGLGLLLEAGLVITWSSAFVGAVLASQTPSVFQVTLWRFLLIALALSPFLWMARRTARFGRWLGLQVALGALGMFACLTFGIKAIDLGVPAGTASLIGALQPLLTAALAGPFLGERVLARQWMGLLVGFGGVAVAIGEIGAADLLGYTFTVISMLSIVAATLLAKAKWDNSHFLAGLCVQAAVTALATAPIAWYDAGLLPAPDPTFLAALAWAIVLSTGGAYGLYYLCLRRSSTVRIGSLIYLTPPVTMVWAYLMFGQPLTLAGIAGFAICILGVILARPG